MSNNIKGRFRSPLFYVLTALIIVSLSINAIAFSNMYINNQFNGQPNKSVFSMEGILTIAIDGNVVYEKPDAIGGTFGNIFACKVFNSTASCAVNSDILGGISLSTQTGPSSSPASVCYFGYISGNGYSPVVANVTTLNNAGNTGVVLTANYNNITATNTLATICLTDISAGVAVPTVVGAVEQLSPTVTVNSGQTMTITWTIQWTTNGNF